MKNYAKLIIGFALAFAVISCNKEEYKAPSSKTLDMAGRWWTELYFDGNGDGVPNPDFLIFSYADFGGYGIATSNTAANDADSMIIEDVQGSWPFRIKAPVNLAERIFTPATVLNIQQDYLGSGETVTIKEGKILKGAAHAKSGRVADSIYLKFEFSDDPGSIYIYTGHRDSGQPDDQY